jgi:Tfp pilus assembly protein PilO
MKELNLNGKMWIYAGICIGAVLYLLYQFYSIEWSVFRDENDRLENLINLKKMELGKIMAQSQRKVALKKEIESAESEFVKLKEMFPDKDFIPKRLQDLNKAARNANVVPKRFKPAQVVPKAFYTENYYNVKMASNFHGLGTFFQEIANFKYPTAINGVTIIQNREALKALEEGRHTGDLSNFIFTEFELKTFTSKQ